jgi:hypothetical protein
MSTVHTTLDTGPRAERKTTKEFKIFDEQCPVISCFFNGGGKINFKRKPVVDKNTGKQKKDEFEVPIYEELPAVKENIQNVRYNHPGKSFEKMYGWETWKIIPGDGPNQWQAVADPNGVVYVFPDGYCEIAATPNNIEKFKKLVKERVADLESGRRAAGFSVDKKGVKKQVHPSYIEPPLFQKAAERRDLGLVKDGILHDLIRPWLRQFIKTDKDVGMM